MTRGRTATPDPFDLSAVSSSDELFDALSERRFAGLSAGRTDDPAASLLAALAADVDLGAPPLPTPSRVTCGVQGSCRRGVRAFVTFGVAALVLTSAGAAAAGGNDVGAMGTDHGSVQPKDSERSNENVQHHDPVSGSIFTGGRSPSPHAGDRHRSLPPPAEPDSASASEPAGASVPVVEDGPKKAPADQPEWEHPGRRWTWEHQRSSVGSHHQRSADPSSPPEQKSEPEPTPPTS
ncbi:hypothetical protein GCM10027176_23000 [Actinoallomurus bryophytorum]|uniref:Uncharacterized protein n=1 Tax=Actinoallomurus bryophytorum TaxID=1490222 RepID=A0A543CM38_9ACTN|nr:hypothetical protein [Actinoallomurus bryophytorum]TQL98155.1 hypothetical protein FB559_3774 [Actinoallomurus bryophytorum]